MLRSIAAGDKLASAWCRRAFGSVPKIVTIEVEAGWTTPLKHQLFRPAACLGFNKLAPRLDSSNVPIKKICEGFFFRLRLRCYMKTPPIPGKPHPSGSCRAAWQQKPPEVSVPCWREQQEPLPRRRGGRVAFSWQLIVEVGVCAGLGKGISTLAIAVLSGASTKFGVYYYLWELI